VTRVREQYFAARPDFLCQDVVQLLHGIAAAGQIAGIDVRRREESAALVDVSAPGEVDQGAVVFCGDRRQPFLELVADVRKRGFGAEERMHVLGKELAACRGGQGGADQLGITFGVEKLVFLGEMGIGGDADDDGVALPDGRGRFRCGRVHQNAGGFVLLLRG
jgi:hypothetical protein